MSRKNTLEYVIEADKSLAASFISPVTVIKNLDNCSYQINVATTNSTGTFAIEISNDYEINEPTNNVSNPGEWAALPIGGTPTVAASDDIIVVNLNQLPFKAMRVSYTSTVAGTGICDIKLVAKQIGG